MAIGNEGGLKKGRPTTEDGEGQEASVVFESPEAATAAIVETRGKQVVEAVEAEQEGWARQAALQGAMAGDALDMKGPEVAKARWMAIANARMNGLR